MKVFFIKFKHLLLFQMSTYLKNFKFAKQKLKFDQLFFFNGDGQLIDKQSKIKSKYGINKLKCSLKIENGKFGNRKGKSIKLKCVTVLTAKLANNNFSIQKYKDDEGGMG